MSAAPEQDPDAVRARLADRYGGPARPRRRLLLVLGVLAVVVAVALAAVVTNEPVRTQAMAYRQVDRTTVEVTFAVIKDPQTVADCTVTALGPAFEEVGVATIRVGPDPGSDVVPVTVSVRTAAPAEGARVEGCTVVEAP